MAKQLCANCGREMTGGRDIEVYSGKRLELCVRMCPRCYQMLEKHLEQFEEDLEPEESKA
jgi:ribosomal protein S27AE